MGTQLLQLKGGDIFQLINSMCRLVYLIYTIKSNFLTLIHTCSFHMNDVIKCIQQGIINCNYLDMYRLIESHVANLFTRSFLRKPFFLPEPQFFLT